MNLINNRNILLAPNSFKGSLDAFEFCRILATELEECGFHTISLPLGDGGDGTARIVAHYLHALPIMTKTVDALGREHFASYYLKDNTAIIELAEACGLKHLKREEYDILNTNTAGFGVLINHALSQGATHLILCVGGSASVDGGTGALQEMGLTIVNNSSNRNYITDIKEINTKLLQQRFNGIHITILCDLDNQLCLWSALLKQHTGKDVTRLKHGGAAGGITAAMHALLNAQLVSGSEYCLTLSHFHDNLLQAGIVITGEGKIDIQSFYGKIPGTVATLCLQQNVPVYAVVGLAEKQVLTRFDKVFTMSQYARSIQDSIKNAPYYLKIIAQAIVDALYSSAYSD